MAFTDRAQTYVEALDNLTEENWHTERSLIEARVSALRAEVEADLSLWEALASELPAQHPLLAMVALRVASLKTALQ